MSQPLEKSRHTEKTPDPSYIVMEDMKNMMDKQRLQDELNKKDAQLLDAQNAQKVMIELLASNENLLKEQIDLLKLQRPLGKTFDMSFTLPVGSKLAHIDFIAGARMSTLPPNINFQFPNGKLYSLTIANDGPGVIVYSTNEPRNSSTALAKLLPNESYEDKFPFPTFETLNIALEGGSTSPASVRIRGLA